MKSPKTLPPDDPRKMLAYMEMHQQQIKIWGDRLYKGIMAARVVGAFLVHFGRCNAFLGPSVQCREQIGHRPPHRHGTTTW